MKKLEGGFINQVYLENGVVVKTFNNDSLVGVASAKRISNEAAALKIFGGTLAPRLISLTDITLRQEFIDGETYEVKARRGERVFEAAGRVLLEIHGARNEPAIFLEEFYRDRFAQALQKAGAILALEDLTPSFAPDRETLAAWGTCYIHGDFWLGNVLGGDGERPKVIDWEFSGLGSPFADFAIVELWIFREFPGSSVDFWRGYGRQPDQRMIDSFLILRCVEFLATTTLERYLLEEKDGFYHNKVMTLQSLAL